MPEGLRVGLIGCGIWGANILRDLRALGARVVVVDTDPRARARARANGADEVAGSPVGGVEGWIVASPASTHATVIEAIAASGLPILCEKPLAGSLADAERIQALVRGPLHLSDVWRYHPAVVAMQEMVESRVLGVPQGLRLTRANWTSPRQDIDTLWNLGPHEISTFFQVFGHFPEPRCALADCPDGQVRGLVSLWGGTPWFVSEISNRHAERRREIRLHGETGVARYDVREPTVLEVASGEADPKLEAGERRRIALGSQTALARQLAAWLGYLGGGEPPLSDLEHGVRVMRALADLRRLAGLPR